MGRRKRHVRTYVCWVCMVGVRSSDEFYEHEISEDHKRLYLEQACGRDKGPEGIRRERKRNLHIGVDDRPEDRVFRACFKEQLAEFCVCVMSWRIGKCERCCDAERDENILQKKVQEVTDQVKQERQYMLERKAKRSHLRVVQPNCLEEYDPDSHHKTYDTDKGRLYALYKKLNDKLVAYRNIKQAFADAKSPLVTSKVRKKIFRKTLLFGNEVVNPAVLVEAAPLAISRHAETAKKRITTIVLGDPIGTEAECSPLLASSHRRNRITLVDALGKRSTVLAAENRPSLSSGQVRERIKSVVPKTVREARQTMVSLQTPSLLSKGFLKKNEPERKVSLQD